MGGEDSTGPAELLAAARCGDRDAFARFVRQHEARVAALLRRILDDPRDVEEAVQDTFVQAWRNLGGYRGDAAVSTWLYRIATNTALMRARRRPRPTVPLDDTAAEGRLPVSDPIGELAERRSDRHALRAALAALPFEQRVVVVLRDVDGCSTAEVAESLEVSVAAVKTRLHRGRLALRAALYDHDREARRDR